MIVSFGDRPTEGLYHGEWARFFPPDILDAALEKLDMLDAAHQLEDMRIPPGNRLKRLKGDLRSFYSIRVNRQWRIIFRWTPDGVRDVTLSDYHS